MNQKRENKNKAKSGFFKKINRINKLILKLTRKKRKHKLPLLGMREETQFRELKG